MRSTWAWSRAAWRAARPPLRLRWASSVMCGPSMRRRLRGAPPLPAGAGTSAAPVGRALRELDALLEVRERACRWGNASASTKCSWKRGSTAVSIFSTRRVTSSISRRAAADSSAIIAPVPAELPAALTRSRSQSGISPRTIAWSGSIWLPNAPASRTSSTASMPAWSMSRRTPAYSAALASWIARTSFWVTRMRGSPAWSTYENVRPSGTMRAVRSASDPSMIPSGVITPARNSSAITSTMPEPQIPLTPSSAAASANPGSSDHSSEPMIRKRGSSVSRSIRTRSMAPGAARCPDEICAPSKAGPVGDEAASSARGCRARSRRSSRRRRRAGPHPRRGAASRRGSRRPCPRRRARRCTAARTHARRGAR